MPSHKTVDRCIRIFFSCARAAGVQAAGAAACGLRGGRGFLVLGSLHQCSPYYLLSSYYTCLYLCLTALTYSNVNEVRRSTTHETHEPPIRAAGAGRAGAAQWRGREGRTPHIPYSEHTHRERDQEARQSQATSGPL